MVGFEILCCILISALFIVHDKLGKYFETLEAGRLYYNIVGKI